MPHPHRTGHAPSRQLRDFVSGDAATPTIPFARDGASNGSPRRTCRHFVSTVASVGHLGPLLDQNRVEFERTSRAAPWSPSRFGFRAHPSFDCILLPE